MKASHILNGRKSASAFVNARTLLSSSEVRLYERWPQLGEDHYFDAETAKWGDPLTYVGEFQTRHGVPIVILRHHYWMEDVENIHEEWTPLTIKSSSQKNDIERDGENEDQIAKELEKAKCEVLQYQTSGRRIKKRIKKAFKGMEISEKRTVEFDKDFMGFYITSSKSDFGKKAIVRFRYVSVPRSRVHDDITYEIEVGYQFREDELK